MLYNMRYSLCAPAIPPSFFFNDTATTEIYTLSLHDALPIWWQVRITGPAPIADEELASANEGVVLNGVLTDRKSTRLNSSHQIISYAVFCLKKKINKRHKTTNLHHSTPAQPNLTYVLHHTPT